MDVPTSAVLVLIAGCQSVTTSTSLEVAFQPPAINISPPLNTVMLCPAMGAKPVAAAVAEENWPVAGSNHSPSASNWPNASVPPQTRTRPVGNTTAEAPMRMTGNGKLRAAAPPSGEVKTIRRLSSCSVRPSGSCNDALVCRAKASRTYAGSDVETGDDAWACNAPPEIRPTIEKMTAPTARFRMHSLIPDIDFPRSALVCRVRNQAAYCRQVASLP